MKTFKVSDVEKNKNKLENANLSIYSIVKNYVEKSSLKSGNVSQQGFLRAVNAAYSKHYPLILSPDHIWIIIAQGLAKHIELNSETLRHKFVNFEGKQTIIVDNNFLRLYDETSPWEDVFPMFSEKISEYIGKKRDLIECDFTTTDAKTKLVSQIVLMDTMKTYFDYRVRTLCGIPEISLMGTREDWVKLRDKVNAISEFNLKWWTDKLLPICDEFVNAFDDKINTKFWAKIYKEEGGSGGPYISGWITHLIPYINDKKNHIICNSNNDSMYSNTLTSDLFPNEVSSVDFVWEYFGKEIKMQFIGGFMSFDQLDDGSIIPSLDWAILNKEKEVKFKMIGKDEKDQFLQNNPNLKLVAEKPSHSGTYYDKELKKYIYKNINIGVIDLS
ncbi:MAG: DUF4419 domain-containing protein [Chitinophagales bacterium]|nr:DUF4419 domain-containing protein [Chitinophagales bacterium]